MDKKGHPILMVLAVLVGVALVLGVSVALIFKLFLPSTNFSFNNKIGVIPIEGVISDSLTITAQLEKFRRDKRIKAIVLRIDSPGGSIGPTQEICREVRKTAKAKTIVASMGGVAASGGYYIAVAADKIVANPGTITGSIGVIMHFVRFRELLDKIGIHFEVLKSGEFKDIGSPHRELTKNDKKLLNAMIAEIKRQFVEEVAKDRGLSVERVEKISDGRIILGSEAQKLDLVDSLGNFQDAVELAKKLAGIKGEVTLVYPRKENFRLWEIFLNSLTKSVIQQIGDVEEQMEYRWSGF